MRSLGWISVGVAIAFGVACSKADSNGASAQTSSASSSSAGGASGAGGAGGDSSGNVGGDMSVASVAQSTSPNAAVSSGSFGAGGADSGCAGLGANVLSLLALAQKCSLGGPLGQCTDLVGGVCCPVLVVDKDSAQSNDYEAALLAYQEAGCHFDCPATPCDVMPKGICAENGADSNVYQCSPQ